MTPPLQSRSNLGAMPNGVASLLVEPTSSVIDARRDEQASARQLAAARAGWSKRLFVAQCVIAAALFVKWLGHHTVVSASIMAVLVFVPLTALQLLTGLFTIKAKRKVTGARSKLAAARQGEVEYNLASLSRGPYRWVRQGGEYLAVFTDAGLLYHFGSASGDRHWMLDANRTVREVQVAVRTTTSQTATSTTEHGRRVGYVATNHVAVLGKGKSTTSTRVETTVTTSHVLEIQVQPEAGAQPIWIALPFGADGRGAEDWKLLVSQLRS